MFLHLLVKSQKHELNVSSKQNQIFLWSLNRFHVFTCQLTTGQHLISVLESVLITGTDKGNVSTVGFVEITTTFRIRWSAEPRGSQTCDQWGPAGGRQRPAVTVCSGFTAEPAETELVWTLNLSWTQSLWHQPQCFRVCCVYTPSLETELVPFQSRADQRRSPESRESAGLCSD